MVFYIDDWRSKKEIEMERSQYVADLIYQQNTEIEQLKYKNKKLQETINILNDILKITDCEYGKYLQLKELYKEL